MFRFLALLLVLLCLLTGCVPPGGAGQQPETSQALDAFLENQPDANEMGAVDFSLDDPMDTLYPYTGQPLEIPFTITGASAGRASEVGVLLFVDGVLQPYGLADQDGTELAEDAMQVFHLEEGEKNSFHMVFQPVTGRVGETLSIIAVTIWEPSFLAEGQSNPRYGFYHSHSATLSRHISFEADAPAGHFAVPSTTYETLELTKEVLDRLSAWGALEALDTTAELSLAVPEGNVIRSDGKKATITVQLYGGPEASFHITLFVNHRPVQINGGDYLSVHTKKNKMVEAAFQIDTAGLGERNTVYAIAVAAGADDELEINTPIKTPSILLLNQED